ncbi:MAG: hypothetical protein PHT07_14045, partial [Paludibacter sp.]|nr:hypothetical protein [Paludibacter sp.]
LFHEIRPVWDAYDLGIITAICVRIDNAVFKALHNLVYGGLFLYHYFFKEVDFGDYDDFGGCFWKIEL